MDSVCPGMDVDYIIITGSDTLNAINLSIPISAIQSPYRISTLLQESVTLLKSPRLHHEHHSQTCNHQRKRDRHNQDDTTSACGKLAPNDPVLTLEIPMEADDQHHNADAQERRTQWLAHLAEV
jgi:hypothetical protein